MERENSVGFLKRSRHTTEELGSFKIIHTDYASGDDNPSESGVKTTSEYKIVYNETRQTNRHKNPSGVWKYFALATKDTSASNIADDPPDDRILCMLCYSKGRVHVYKSKTSSSNLWKHLNRKHNIEIPTEKMFTILSSSIFDLGTDGEEHPNPEDENSIDGPLSVLDVDDNDEIVVKTHDFVEASPYQEQEQTIKEELDQKVEEIVKYEPCSTDAVFKDIGMAIIKEVAKRPILYEIQLNKSPSIRAVKDMMWVEVYEALGEIIQIDRVQKIWKNIRDRYRKIRCAEKEGLDGRSQKYKYYSQLNFLDASISIDQTSDTSSNDPPEKKCRTDDFSFLIEQNDAMLPSFEEIDRIEQNYVAEEIIHDNNCTVSSSNPPLTSSSFPVEATETNSEEDASSKQCSSCFASHCSEQMDEFDLFGKLIAKKLRSAPKERVNMIEMKIMQAILENS